MEAGVGSSGQCFRRARPSWVSLCYLHSVCLTEALLLGVKGGVSPASMLEVIQHSTGRSYVADRYGPEILNGGYDDTFASELAVKDLRLASEMAATGSTTMSLGFARFAMWWDPTWVCWSTLIRRSLRNTRFVWRVGSRNLTWCGWRNPSRLTTFAAAPKYVHTPRSQSRREKPNTLAMECGHCLTSERPTC